MPAFTNDGERTFVSYITGPSHVRLGIRFGSEPAAPSIVRQDAIGICRHGEIDESRLIEAVMEGVAAVNRDLNVVEIVYIANDSARYDLYSHCAKLLAERFLQMNPNIPTPEMFAFYERRTNEHIERVRRCLTLMAEGSDSIEELIERAKVHDASKFGQEERIPYVWLTESHRRRRNGERFEYPVGVAQEVKAAIHHHVTSNRHHPEFHADPNDMSDVDLIEMVCDWTAMAQEFDQCGGSARGWADKTVGKRVAFNDEKRRFIYQMIEELDRRIAASQ